eukprot:GHVQ01035553.1.p1 GENE.GHVQ01035553.1~~GHVQ01035553.1.p1  ORF type:complete len:429 (-),score=64.42 GHVQ01035553.1:360-1646(-)
MKLLPCRAVAGLATLFTPLVLAQSPFKTVGIEANKTANNRFTFRAFISAVLHTPPSPTTDTHSVGLRLDTLMGAASEAKWRCPVVDRASVFIRLPRLLSSKLRTHKAYRLSDGTFVHTFKGEDMGRLQDVSWADILSQPIRLPMTHWPVEVERHELESTLTRKPRRLQASLLFLFTNRNPLQSQTFWYHDLIPFYLKPLVHSMRVTLTKLDGHDPRSDEVLWGADAFEALQLRWTPTDGKESPTLLSFSQQLLPMTRLTLRVEILKAHLHNAKFDFSVERGQDMASGTLLYQPPPHFLWTPRPSQIRAAFLPCDSSNTKTPTGPSSSPPPRHRLLCVEDIPTNTTTTNSGQAQDKSGGVDPERGYYGWAFTEAIVLQVALPDITMPFNVIAVACTVLTFFFGAMFRITTARLTSTNCKTPTTADSCRN